MKFVIQVNLFGCSIRSKVCPALAPKTSSSTIFSVWAASKNTQARWRTAKTRSSRRLKVIDFPLNSVQLVAGFIEDTIRYPGLPAVICFAYVDFDFYEPIKVTLEFLHVRLPSGTHVLVDDYGWFSSGAKAAVDEFVAAYASNYVCSIPLPFAGPSLC